MVAAMPNNAQEVIKGIGAVLFLVVAIIIFASILMPHDNSTPPEMRGCYASTSGKIIVLGKNDIRVNNGSDERFLVRFSRTNLGNQLNLSPGAVPKVDKNGILQLVHHEPGNIIRISGSQMTFYTEEQEEYHFRKATC
jgi:hypothetical protein